jgi:PIN domain nuclease of toxin-antitoxin system
VREFILLAHCNKFKVKKGKLKLDIFDFIEKELGFKIKYVAKEHLKTYSNLEIAENHDDTFDHLIIAHAITEKIPIISSDAYFPKYKKQGLELISNKRK